MYTVESATTCEEQLIHSKGVIVLQKPGGMVDCFPTARHYVLGMPSTVVSACSACQWPKCYTYSCLFETYLMVKVIYIVLVFDGCDCQLMCQKQADCCPN
jgi:hypothetical protein